MEPSADRTDDVVQLCRTVGLAPEFVSGSAELLSGALGAAVASFVGLQVRLLDKAHPVTCTWFAPATRLQDLGTSLRIPLSALRQRPGPEAGGAIVVYARTPGALVDLAADLTHALRWTGPGLRLDEDLDPGPLTSGLRGVEEVSLIDRASGFLIGEGWDPDDVASELVRRAALAGVTVLAYAASLVRPDA